MLFKKADLKHFRTFTGKHLRWSLFFNFPKYRPKNSKLSVVLENRSTRYIGGADSEFGLKISKFRPQNPFLGKFGSKKSNVVCFA